MNNYVPASKEVTISRNSYFYTVNNKQQYHRYNINLADISIRVIICKQQQQSYFLLNILLKGDIHYLMQLLISNES